MIFELNISGNSNTPLWDLGGSWNGTWKLLSPLGFESRIFEREASGCPPWGWPGRHGFRSHPFYGMKMLSSRRFGVFKPNRLSVEMYVRRKQREVSRKCFLYVCEVSFLPWGFLGEESVVPIVKEERFTTIRFGTCFLGNTISSSRGFDLALLEVPECPLETGTQCDSAGSEEVSSLIYGAISVPPLQDKWLSSDVRRNAFDSKNTHSSRDRF